MIYLDGGFGTMIQAAGLPAGKDPTDWNIENPAAVTSVHRAYVEAGSDIVLTNTFGANRLKYAGAHDLAALVRAAIANARASGAKKVALDIGPTGRLLAPAGDLSFDEAYKAFAEVVQLAVAPATFGATYGSALDGPRSPQTSGSPEMAVSPISPEMAVSTSSREMAVSPSSREMAVSPSSREMTVSPSSCEMAVSPSSCEMVDLIFIETISDLRELKAAVLAAKENSNLPVFASVALGEDGRLLTGGTVECVAALLESLDVDAYGFNCGFGPDRMLPFVERLARVSTKPIIVKPNAGLPEIVDGKTLFRLTPNQFAVDVRRLLSAGATVVGGCCGTTPDHIRATVVGSKEVDAFVSNTSEGESSIPSSIPSSTPSTIPSSSGSVVSSGTVAISLRPHEGLIIGERINPTGKKLLKEAYQKGDTAYVLREAVKQIDAGAQILDVNCGVPGLDEAALLPATVESVQSVATCPLQIDTADSLALERALRLVNGKPLVNSVNGKRESMSSVFPLVKRYGGLIVALCLDEAGIPATVEGRLSIARKILAEGAKYGFTKDDFVFDALTLAVSAEPMAARVTLETVRRLTEELGVNTVLGVSNVSFGLPNRVALNNTMYALAKRAGLSAAIANPLVIRDEIDPDAEAVLMGTDENCARWIEKCTSSGVGSSVVGNSVPGVGSSVAGNSVAGCASSPEGEMASLVAAIRSGLKDDAEIVAKRLLQSGRSTMELINGGIVPALEEVGQKFEKGTVFLPQLLRAADAAGAAFGVVKAMLASQPSAAEGTLSTAGRRPIVLATVKGDVHDIGKNIVRALLENYGFDVIDLGRDVPPEKIVETARRTNAYLIGLSALMTTTVGAMEETIRQARAAALDAKVVVGGAVVTQEFADSIGADFYAKDAMKTVRIAERLLSQF